MIRKKGTENSYLWTARSIKDSGEMVGSMDWANSFIKTRLLRKGNKIWARSNFK